MGYLFAAFAVVWIVFFVYLISLDKRHRAIADEMEDLRGKLSGPSKG